LTAALNCAALTLTNLATARRIWRRFDAVISIEDPGQSNGLKLPLSHAPRHLVLQIADLAEPLPGFSHANAIDVVRIIEFARSIRGDLLIHCNHGLSRCPAVALAILADRMGAGREPEALQTLLKWRKDVLPNQLIVSLADAALERNGALLQALIWWREAKLSETELPSSIRATQETDDGFNRRPPMVQNANAISARVSRIIPAPPDKVFAFVADASNDPQWIAPILHSRRLDSGPIQVGSRFEQSAVGPGGRANVIWEITEYTEESRVVGRSISGGYHFVGGYELEKRSTGTLVTKFAWFERSGLLLGVPKIVGNALMRQYFEAWLGTLARRRWGTRGE
jgi:predicted protein tyrosine phosphatase